MLNVFVKVRHLPSFLILILKTLFNVPHLVKNLHEKDVVILGIEIESPELDRRKSRSVWSSS